MLSASKINTWYGCPFKFYCHYVKRLQQIKTPSGPKEFGSAIHDIIVRYYDKITETSSQAEIVEKMEEAFVEGSDYRIDIFRSRIKNIQSRLREFEFDRLKKGLYKPSLLEKRLIAQPFEGLPPIEIIIDAYYEDAGLIVDWKTGEYEEMSESRMIQGKTYEVVMKINGYKVNTVLFNNLTVGKQIPLPKITDSWLEMKVRELVETIKREEFKKIPGNLCNRWCGYLLSCGLSDECSWGFR